MRSFEQKLIATSQPYSLKNFGTVTKPGGLGVVYVLADDSFVWPGPDIRSGFCLRNAKLAEKAFLHLKWSFACYDQLRAYCHNFIHLRIWGPSQDVAPLPSTCHLTGLPELNRPSLS